MFCDRSGVILLSWNFLERCIFSQKSSIIYFGVLMRIKFLFKIEKLPIIYRHRFVALIKESLSKSDEKLKNLYYPEKSLEKTKIAKPFSFAVKLPRNKSIVKENIEIDDGVTIEEEVFYFPENSFISYFITSYDYNFLISLYNAIITLKEFELFRGINIHFIKAVLLKEKKIDGNKICFRTLSPILIEDKDENPLLPIENLELFNRELNLIEGKIKKDLLGSELKSNLVLTPIQVKKEKVKITIRNHRKENPILLFTPFSGTFVLEGDSEDLNFLYQKGIGLRTGQGFGMVEMV